MISHNSPTFYFLAPNSPCLVQPITISYLEYFEILLTSLHAYSLIPPQIYLPHCYQNDHPETWVWSCLFPAQNFQGFPIGWGYNLNPLIRHTSLSIIQHCPPFPPSFINTSHPLLFFKFVFILESIIYIPFIHTSFYTVLTLKSLQPPQDVMFFHDSVFPHVISLLK